MRELHIVCSDIVSMVVVFIGPKELNHRKEFENLEDFLDSLPESIELNSKKPIGVYLEGVENGIRNYVEKRMSDALDDPTYL